MTDTDRFEARFEARLQARADLAMRPFDDLGIARDAMAVARRHRSWWPAPGLMAAIGPTPQRLRMLLLTVLTALVAGGALVIGSQLVRPSPVRPIPADRGMFTLTGSMTQPRWGHTATLLEDGRVLIEGGSPEGQDGVRGASAGGEIWDPITGSFGHGGPEPGNGTRYRVHHTATLLSDGRVLVLGGGDATRAHPVNYTADIWDPGTDTVSQTGPVASRHDHTATLLPDGRVLIIGGVDANFPALSVEIWDPTTGHTTLSGALAQARARHTATLLTDGRVLVVGGIPIASEPGGNEQVVLDAAELWDPATGSFTQAGHLDGARAGHVAVLLPDDRVLIVGGVDASGPVLSIEIWDPTTGHFSAIGTVARPVDTATMMSDGRVLLIGGESADLWDPATGAREATGSPVVSRSGDTATLLSDGRVLVVGGDTLSKGGVPSADPLVSAELFGFDDATPASPVEATRSTQSPSD